eukprot:COSAG05_NODE_8178_length_728_cov_5.416534_2_plen_85_part_00
MSTTALCAGMGSFDWRVDVKTSSRRSQAIDEPTVVLGFSSGGLLSAGDEGGETVRCEADRRMVGEVLKGLDEIKAQIDIMTGKN